MDRFEVLLSRGQDENPRRSGFDERFSGTTVPPGKPEDGEAVPFTTPFFAEATDETVGLHQRLGTRAIDNGLA